MCLGATSTNPETRLAGTHRGAACDAHGGLVQRERINTESIMSLSAKSGGGIKYCDMLPQSEIESRLTVHLCRFDCSKNKITRIFWFSQEWQIWA